MLTNSSRKRARAHTGDWYESASAEHGGAKRSSSNRFGALRNPATIGIALLCLAGAIAISVSLFDGHDMEIATADQGGNQSAASESAQTATKQICVHITGCVAAPGVVTIPANSRVIDAIEAAGGFTDEADSGALNLARPLSDGEQVVVPSQTDKTASGVSQDDTPAIDASVSSAYIGSKLNINRATQGELESLTGIGPSIAARIVEYREINGPFASVQDIMRVSGIGKKKYEQIENSICIG